jgi:hypothetical protein
MKQPASLTVLSGQYGVRSCNITKEMLYWPPDQTITDRICKEQFITSTSRGNAKEVIFLLEKDFADFLEESYLWW